VHQGRASCEPAADLARAMLRAMRQAVAGVLVAVVALAAGGCHGPRKDGARPQAEARPTTADSVPAQPAGNAGAKGDRSGESAKEQAPPQDPADDSDAEPAPIPPPPDVAAPPKNAKRSPKGVLYRVLVAGKGPKPTVEDTVKVHYTGWTTDGKMFDSSVQRGQPAEFPLKHLIAGWTDAIPLMSVGEKTRLWIPEELAYKGKPGVPQGMLVFDVELLEIMPKP
jgi:FKBP-type peptidyl-prolyl cis-trans isomerase